MFRTFCAAAALSVLTLAAAAQQPPPPAALLAAVAATQNAKAPYAFDLDLTATGQSLRTHFDPRATPRVSLLQPSADQLSPRQRRALELLQQQLDGLSWCAGPRMGNIVNVRQISEDAGSASYAFQPTRESMRGDAAQYADHLRGELTLTKTDPDITRIHIFLPAAFDPIPFVHIARFDVAITCVAGPNGRRYAAETIAQIAGNAFGQSLDQNTMQRVSGLSAAP